MDCRAAREILDHSSPGDSGSEALEARAHEAGCERCSSLMASRLAFDDRLSAAMQDVAIPEGLRDRLLTAVSPEPMLAITVKQPVRRRRPTMVAACVATVLIAGSATWITIARQRKPKTLDLAALRTAAATLLEQAGNTIDLSRVPGFDGSFSLAALNDWSRSAELHGVEIDQRPGQDGAAAMVRIGRSSRPNAILLIVPASRVADAAHLAAGATLAYAPVASAVWRNGDFVFVCCTIRRNAPELQRFASNTTV
jgi:hypothetical protein